MAYMMFIQMAKIVAMFSWQGYILIFGALAKLLSDRGADLKVTSLKSCVTSWAYGKLGLHPAMLKPMDKLSELTKYFCT